MRVYFKYFSGMSEYWIAKAGVPAAALAAEPSGYVRSGTPSAGEVPDACVLKLHGHTSSPTTSGCYILVELFYNGVVTCGEAMCDYCCGKVELMVGYC